MANYLRYTYQLVGATWNGSELEASSITFDDVDSAKGMMDFSECDFTGLSPEWTLENDDKTLVLKVPFTDAQAHVEMKAFHENVKDTWTVTGSIDGSTLTEILQPDNKYVIGDTEI
jgi:hypothetical protein